MHFFTIKFHGNLLYVPLHSNELTTAPTIKFVALVHQGGRCEPLIWKVNFQCNFIYNLSTHKRTFTVCRMLLPACLLGRPLHQCKSFTGPTICIYQQWKWFSTAIQCVLYEIHSITHPPTSRCEKVKKRRILKCICALPLCATMCCAVYHASNSFWNHH